MKYVTKVTLDQADLEQAVLEFVKANVGLAADVSTSVEFFDDDQSNLTAEVAIETSLGLTGEEAAKPDRKPTRRARNENKTVAASAPAPATTTSVAETEPTTGSTETEATVEEPPFEPDTKPEEPVVSEKETAPAPATPKIFPSATSSAAPETAPKPDPTVAAKSLFANLTKPN